MGIMLDMYCRTISYLRISITDNCNLRCIYCLGKGNTYFKKEHELLSFDEVIRVVSIAAKLGIEKIRITGGEPLMRKNVCSLVRKIKNVEGIKEVLMTTNGILLNEYLEELIDSGVNKINLSLDSIDHEKYRKLTGGGELSTIIEVIDRCIEKGVILKLNTVIINSYNNGEILNLIKFALERNIDIRFIEMMPIGLSKGTEGITSDEIKNIIEEEYILKPYEGNILGSGPAIYYYAHSKNYNRGGRIGFISPLTHNFCSSCNRLRITSDGFLKQCLHWKYGVDLKNILRKGVSDDELEKIIKNTILNKPNKHNFGTNNQDEDKRLMSQIGG